MKKFLSFFLLVFLSISSVKAYTCYDDERERLQKLASNITYILEEVQNGDDFYFNAIFTGLSDELLVYSEQKILPFYNFTDYKIGETVVSGLFQGKTYVFNINGTRSCPFTTLRRFIINVPVYNKYYNDPICEDAKEYNLCLKWYDNNLSYDEFVANVENYISNKKINNNSNGSSNNSINTYDSYLQFMKWYDKYYVWTLGGFIVALIVLIYFWLKENKKNRL